VNRQYKGLCNCVCLAGTMRRGGALAVYQGFWTSFVMFSYCTGASALGCATWRGTACSGSIRCPGRGVGVSRIHSRIFTARRRYSVAIAQVEHRGHDHCGRWLACVPARQDTAVADDGGGQRPERGAAKRGKGFVVSTWAACPILCVGCKGESFWCCTTS
jgi:hypothetical protein